MCVISILVCKQKLIDSNIKMKHLLLDENILNYVFVVALKFTFEKDVQWEI